MIGFVSENIAKSVGNSVFKYCRDLQRVCDVDSEAAASAECLSLMLQCQLHLLKVTSCMCVYLSRKSMFFSANATDTFKSSSRRFVCQMLSQEGLRAELMVKQHLSQKAQNRADCETRFVFCFIENKRLIGRQ